MSIRDKAIDSGKWVTISTLVQSIFQFLQIAVLARLLDPMAFGLVSMSVVFTSFFSIFAGLGFSNSIIYKQETDSKILSTVYYVNIMLGVLMFLLITLLSPLVVLFYNEPRLHEVINTSAIIFLFGYFGSVQSILLRKELRFKSVAIIDIMGNAVGFPLTIFMACNGFAELSIVYGTVASQATRTCLEIYYGRDLFLPKLYFRIKDIQDHLRFGIFNSGESIVNFIQNNWDNLIIGRILGAKYLGIYTLALQLGYYPVSKLNPLILQVAYPLIAKLKDDVSAFKRTYLKILDILSYFNYPLLAGLFITVENVVPLVYGRGWEDTFPLIRIFVFVSALSCIAHPLFTIAYSKGKANYLFYLGLITLVIKIPVAYIFGKYWSVTGVAVGIFLTTLINLTLNLMIVHKLIGNFLWEFLFNILKPISFCLIMVIVVFVYKTLCGQPGLWHTLLQILIGSSIYLGLTFRYKYSIAKLLEFIKLI